MFCTLSLELKYSLLNLPVFIFYLLFSRCRTPVYVNARARRRGTREPRHSDVITGHRDVIRPRGVNLRGAEAKCTGFRDVTDTWSWWSCCTNYFCSCSGYPTARTQHGSDQRGCTHHHCTPAPGVPGHLLRRRRQWCPCLQHQLWRRWGVSRRHGYWTGKRLQTEDVQDNSADRSWRSG